MIDEPTGMPMLDTFRALVRSEIDKQLKRDGYHKRYEGTTGYKVTYEVQMPPTVDWHDMPDPMFDDPPEMQAKHELHLYCYVLGPARQYEWAANSAGELFAKATQEFMGWARESEVEHNQESMS